MVRRAAVYWFLLAVFIIAGCSEDSGCLEGQELVNGSCMSVCPENATRDAAGNCITGGDTVLPDGDFADGDVTDADTVDGDTEDGDASDGDATDGDATDGDATDGDTTDGDTTDGDLSYPDWTCREGETGCCVDNSDCIRNNCVADVCVPPPAESSLYEDNGTVYTPASGSPDFSCYEYPQAQPFGETGEVEFTVTVYNAKIPCRGLDVDLFPMFGEEGDLIETFDGVDPIMHAEDVQADAPPNVCRIVFSDVPLDYWLVVRLSGPAMRDTYNWAVRAPSGVQSPELGLMVFADASWSSLQSSAGAVVPFDGNGMIFGRVSDCQGRLVQGATAGTSTRPFALAYLNGIIGDTSANPGRTNTNRDGGFVAADIVARRMRLGILAYGEGPYVLDFRVQSGSISFYQPGGYLLH